jgi:hypothetical protein
MAERAFKCPQCNAPLSPSRFARSVVCAYCGATVTIDETTVSAAAYRQAFAAWNAPRTHGFSAWLAVGETRWSPGELLAEGETTNVYAARRARWPTERALVKVLRDEKDRPLLEHEWTVLAELQAGAAESAAAMLARIPEPIVHGEVTDGMYTGAHVSVFRWASGFRHTLEAFQRAYPAGVDPRASIWVWRRILEILAFLHKQGFAHGAVLPPHLLVEDDEHGMRLVGFSAADRTGSRRPVVRERWAAFYPEPRSGTGTLGPELDVVMSARCLAALLGGDARTGEVPAAVPGPLAALVGETAADGHAARAGADAWALREALGQVAREVFGPPQFCPLAMPGLRRA